MKKFLILFLVISAVLCMSCGSTPEAGQEPEAPSQTPPAASTTPSTTTPAPSTTTPASAESSEITQARSKAEQARTRVVDFGGDSYFPSEWSAAQTQFNSARTAAEYDAAAKAFDDIFDKTHPLYAKAREDEILYVRDELISTGLVPYAPNEFKAADDKSISALDQYESGDYYSARDSAAAALDEYETMLIGADTYHTREALYNTGLTPYFQEYFDNAETLGHQGIEQYQAGDIKGARESALKAQEEYETLLFGTDVYFARQDIIDLGFVQYGIDGFTSADELYFAAIDEYTAGNKDAAKTKAEEALLRYRNILADGWVFYSADKRADAVSERQHAINERANIASREYFREAEAFMEEAERLYASRDPDDALSAAIAFTNAQAMYAIAIEDTWERRRRADELIRQANQMIERGNESALEAERIIEGGSR